MASEGKDRSDKKGKGARKQHVTAEDRARGATRKREKAARRVARRAERRAVEGGASPSSAAAAGAAAAAARRDRAPDPVLPPAEAPRFWFGFEVPWAKLAAGRVVLFVLLALDAVLAIQHAPRYGVGGFNVAQIPLLDHHGPDRAQYLLAQLGLAYMFTLVACGVGTRWLVPVCAAIYGWLYFGSQLDSYQHHYLVFLLLVISSFVPWQRPRPARIGAVVDGRTPVRTWAMRLFLVQLAILYFYASISKMGHAWLDGTTLAKQLLPSPTGATSLRSVIDHTIGIAAVAKLVMVTEMGLALTVWWKPAQKVVAWIGIAFHVGILVTGFEIGLFAWIMIGLYAFVIADGVWVWLGDLVVVRAVASVAGGVGRALDGSIGWVIGGLALAAGVMFAFGVRFLFAPTLSAMIAGGIGIVGLYWFANRDTLVGRPRRFAWIGIAHLLAMVLWLGVDRKSSTAVDYFKFWGGSSRRFGDPKGAIEAYEHWIAIDPDDAAPHFQLGRLVLADTPTRGLDELHVAEHLDSAHARAFVAEARWLQAHGKPAEALAKAEEGTYAEPGDREAQALVGELGGKPNGGAGAGAKLLKGSVDSDD